jgi:hypothetical protein
LMMVNHLPISRSRCTNIPKSWPPKCSEVLDWLSNKWWRIVGEVTIDWLIGSFPEFSPHFDAPEWLVFIISITINACNVSVIIRDYLLRMNYSIKEYSWNDY